MSGKGPEAFRTISEAADEVGAPAHVLRFWETKFKAIRPMRRAGGRRFYRPEDVEVLKSIRWLLREDGYSIGEIQAFSKKRVLEMTGALRSAAVASPGPMAPRRGYAALAAALARAIDAKIRLDQALAR